MKKKMKAWWMQKCIDLCIKLNEGMDFDISRYMDGIEVWVRSLVPELSSGCELRAVKETESAVLYEWKKDGVKYRSWVWKEKADESS